MTVRPSLDETHSTPSCNAVEPISSNGSVWQAFGSGTRIRSPSRRQPGRRRGVSAAGSTASHSTPTNPNVQYMGALNQDVIDSANESGVATDPNATYDLPAETPAPEEGSESTDSSDSSSEETDDAA